MAKICNENKLQIRKLYQIRKDLIHNAVREPQGVGTTHNCIRKDCF
jgi:hypothetical protein